VLVKGIGWYIQAGCVYWEGVKTQKDMVNFTNKAIGACKGYCVVYTGKLWVKVLSVGGYKGCKSSSFVNRYIFVAFAKDIIFSYI